MSLLITSHHWLVTLGHADQLSLKIVGRWSLTSWGEKYELDIRKDQVMTVFKEKKATVLRDRSAIDTSSFAQE